MKEELSTLRSELATANNNNTLLTEQLDQSRLSSEGKIDNLINRDSFDWQPGSRSHFCLNSISLTLVQRDREEKQVPRPPGPWSGPPPTYPVTSRQPT